MKIGIFVVYMSPTIACDCIVDSASHLALSFRYVVLQYVICRVTYLKS